MNFRKLLLNRCQKEFEKDQVDDEIFERKQKELDAATVVQYCLKKSQFRVFVYAQNKLSWCFILYVWWGVFEGEHKSEGSHYELTDWHF